MAAHRVNRVREMLLRELSDIVRRLRDPRVGFVTVVDVELSNDLHYATMFVSVLGDHQAKCDAVAGLESALGHIRRQIAQRLTMRQVPEISVQYDDTSERAARVSALIDSIQRDRGLLPAAPGSTPEE